jgi:hypothetical protein
MKPKDRESINSALAGARRLIEEKTKALGFKKTAAEQIDFLKKQPAKWETGLKPNHLRYWTGTTPRSIFFLGDPIRVPVPVRKRGSMVPIGFSMTLEQLLGGGLSIFQVLSRAFHAAT